MAEDKDREFELEFEEPQLSLFETEHRDEKKPALLRCYKNRLVSVENMSVHDLFNGFDEIRVITFSYDVAMIHWLMEKFKYGEILLGADFMVRKDARTASKVAEILAGADMAAQEIRKYGDLVQKMLDGDLVIHSSVNILDHRKLYLLRSDDGRTRVITASANMTRRAWSADQMENVAFYDEPNAYDAYFQEFLTAWKMSADIPYKVVASEAADHPKDANAVLKKVVETNKAVILQTPAEDEQAVITNYQYVMRGDQAKEKYMELLKDTGIRTTKDGVIKINPKIVEKIAVNAQKAAIRKTDIKQIVEKYPYITFDYNQASMNLSGETMDLNPPEDEVKGEIEDLLSIFEKYNSFVGTAPEKQKDIYYKLLNAMFASPFFARLRCEARLINKGTTSLPLYLLISSSHSSTGKSFFVKAILKLMTGKKNLRVLAAKECPSKTAVALQVEGKGVPLFIDEIDNAYLAHMKKAIKTTEQICEVLQNDTVPLLIFASNDVTDPDMQLRKRMIFLDPEGTIPSDADQTAWLSAGNSLISRLGNGLYREYVRRMMPKVWDAIDRMQTNEGESLPDDWYPDIMPLSSETLMEIISDFGFEKPDYFRKLTWRDDFAENASYITADAFREIREMYASNKKAFEIDQNTVTIETGSDKASMRRLQSWAAVMPVEVMKEAPMWTKTGWMIVFHRDELEKRLGIRFKDSWYRKFFKK
ncbi:phospholipase D-like domain-containing protein [uncultured Megasphaera sp.]|uniref:phospholipase D-like domain-containing protein n=1 Tax=uncultured Megasphaera sp. TaxID=165188 RepID=UPI0025D6B24A|nr:phospholipase D-like domain-containing protein [uncultured Megasphaera sp.]